MSAVKSYVTMLQSEREIMKLQKQFAKLTENLKQYRKSSLEYASAALLGADFGPDLRLRVK